jgi:hypothetical protein
LDRYRDVPLFTASQEHTELSRIAATAMGYGLVLILAAEIAASLVYAGMMTFLILVGPTQLQPAWWFALLVHLTITTLSFLSFFGTGFCFFRVIWRRSPVKWLLVGLSVIIMSPVPVLAYEGGIVSLPVQALYYAGWSLVLFITTLAAFSYMELREQDEKKNKHPMLDC